MIWLLSANLSGRAKATRIKKLVAKPAFRGLLAVLNEIAGQKDVAAEMKDEVSGPFLRESTLGWTPERIENKSLFPVLTRTGPLANGNVLGL